ncbi:MAG: nucleotidyltransferase domain-containing protein [Chloroflexota bacterium]|nr:nucleotidyltransferase domain-containing protein [Chloroflexota bacterium]
MIATAGQFTGKQWRSGRLEQFLAGHPYPLLYATVHGSRLYAFDTLESDLDLRGCHVLPVEQVLGLRDGPETVTRKGELAGAGVELVTHEVKKVCRLLLKGNGNVLEEVLSPLVLVTGDFHAELRDITGETISRKHSGHYLGMASQALSVLQKPGKGKVKYALHLYRALLTGVHLMETGKLECRLPVLNGRARLSHVDELLERRKGGPGEQGLTGQEIAFMAGKFDRLMLELKEAADRSPLPAQGQREARLNDLLVRIRRDGRYR